MPAIEFSAGAREVIANSSETQQRELYRIAASILVDPHPDEWEKFQLGTSLPFRNRATIEYMDTEWYWAYRIEPNQDVHVSTIWNRRDID